MAETVTIGGRNLLRQYNELRAKGYRTVASGDGQITLKAGGPVPEPLEVVTNVPVVSGPDVIVHNGGSIFQFEPLTEAAKDWIEENVQAESWQFMGSSLCVEHRYAGDLAAGMIADGLVVE